MTKDRHAEASGVTGAARRSRTVALSIGAGFLPILLVGAIRLGPLMTTLALGGSLLLLLVFLGPVILRSRGSAAKSRFDLRLFDAPAAAPVRDVLRLADKYSDPRRWLTRAIAFGLVQGRLIATPEKITFSASTRAGAESLSFEIALTDIQGLAVDGDRGRAILELSFPDESTIRLQTVNPAALARVVTPD